MVSGDIVSIKVQHPTLGTRTLYAVSNTDNTLNYGGYKAGDDKNSIDGGGRAIDRRNLSRWSAKCTISWNMNDPNGDELSFITSLQNNAQEATYVITHVNTSVWSGTGVPVGDNEGNTQDAQIELNIMGGGLLQKIA